MRVACATKGDTTQQNLVSLPASAPDLSTSKRRAIQLLGEGRSVSQVSVIIGCDRSTVYKWLKEPQVIVERARQANEMRDSAQSRLQGLVHKSIDVVGKALDAGDLKAACAVLKFTGIASMPKPETDTDVRSVIRKQAEAFAEQAWLDRPYAEQTLRKGMYHNETFKQLVHAIWETLQQKYPAGDNEADELLYETLDRQR